MWCALRTCPNQVLRTSLGRRLITSIPSQQVQCGCLLFTDPQKKVPRKQRSKVLSGQARIQIERYNREGEYEKSHTTWKTFLQRGVTPSYGLINAVLYSYRQTHNGPRALELIHTLQDSGVQLDILLSDDAAEVERQFEYFLGTGQKPDAAIYTIVLQSFVTARDVDKAEKYFNQCVHDGLYPQCRSFLLMIQLYDETGQLKKAERLLAENILNHYDEQEEHKIHNFLLSCYVKGRNIEAAENYFALMIKNGISPDLSTYNTLLNLYEGESDIHKTSALLSRLIDVGLHPDATTFNTLLKIYRNMGRFDSMEHLFREMCEKGIATNTSYNTVISAYDNAGKFKLALKVYSDMLSTGLQPDIFTYTTVIKIYGQTGKVQLAIDLFEKWISSSEHSIPQPALYNTMIQAYKRNKEYKKAESTFHEMIARGIKPDLYSYNTILDYYAKTINIASAEYYFEDLKASGLRPNKVSYHIMLDAYRRGGLIEKFNNLLETIEKLGLPKDNYTYGILIAACAQQGDVEMVEHYVKEMAAKGESQGFAFLPGKGFQLHPSTKQKVEFLYASTDISKESLLENEILTNLEQE